MIYFSKNPISAFLKAIMSVIKSILTNLKYCLDIKKMFKMLMCLSVMYIVIFPLLKFIGKLFKNKKNNNSDSSSSTSFVNKKKFRTITSESSCSACKHNSSKSSSKSSDSGSSKSTHINKREVENVLRKFKITA